MENSLKKISQNHTKKKFQKNKLHLCLAHLNTKLINSKTNRLLEHYIFYRIFFLMEFFSILGRIWSRIRIRYSRIRIKMKRIRNTPF